MSTEDTTGDLSGGGASRWSRATQDLSGEWALKGCREIEFEGVRVPTLRGIALLARIGKGGMGVVYFGVHPLLRTEVAVKVLPAALLQQREVLVDRFVREAQLAAGLRSDHLVAVRDVGHDNASGCYFIVMEFVRGVSAGAWADGDGRAGGSSANPPESDALDICIAATRGLAAAHVAGVVHRDIKPDNILLPCDDRGNARCREAKLADLGLARAELGGEGLTGKDVAMGTPGYMAPEQVIDARDARKPADVFGIGATLYSLLANRAPFKGRSASDALVRTATGKYPGLLTLRPDVSPAIVMVVDRCLRRKQQERFPDAPALLDALLVCRSAIRESGPRLGYDDISTQVVAIAEREERGRKVISTAPPAATVVADAETGETRLASDDTPPLPPPLTGATILPADSLPPILDTPIPEPPTSEPEPFPSGPELGPETSEPEPPRPVSRPPEPEPVPPVSRPPEPEPAPPVSRPPEPEPELDPLRPPAGASSFGDATQSIALRALDMVGVRAELPTPEPKSKGRGAKIAAAILVPVALLAALAIWWPGRDPPTPTEPGTAPVEPAPVRPTRPATEPTGALNITTKPPGAVVRVAGEPRGNTPLRVGELAPGRYVVRVEAPFFVPKEWNDVEVRSGKTKALRGDLVRAKGRLVVRSGPPGASVRLVSVLDGPGPPPRELRLDESGALDRADVDAGHYQVTVSAKGLSPYTVDARIDAGGATTVEPTLVPLPGTLTVLAGPPGAQVELNGELIGGVPIEGRELAPGEYVVVVRLAEHVSQRVTVTVLPGEPARVTGIQLTSWPVLDLSGLQPGETGWVDGEPARDGQRAPPGEITVILKRAGHVDQEQIGRARPGSRLRVTADPWERVEATLDLGGLAEGVSAWVDGRNRSGLVTFSDRDEVTVELRRAGFESQSHLVALVAGETVGITPHEWRASGHPVDISRLGSNVVALIDGRVLRHRELLARGTYTLTVRRAGYADHVVALTVPNSGNVVQIVEPHRWTPLPGRMDLSRVGSDVQVLVDGRPVRHGDTIPVGEHQIVLRRPGHRDQRIARHVVTPGATCVITPTTWTRAAASPAEARRLLTDITRWNSASPDARRQAAQAVGAAMRGFRFTGIKRFAAGGESRDIALFVHEATGLEFSLIPVGRFRMGSPGSEVGRDVDEVAHDVVLSQPFLICRTEVPIKVWAQHGGGGGRGGPDHPATELSWTAASQFCRAIGLRLPTEAQWEYACRGGTRGAFAFGSDASAAGEYAWFRANASRVKQAVAQKRPNAFGLFDMHGNVWEWCRDGYDRYPRGEVTDPVGDPNARYRVFRGGDIRGTPYMLRSAGRAQRGRDYEDDALGLRPIAEVTLE